MTFAAVVRAGVLASALAVTLTHGYAFSETSDASKVEDSTGLTVNEEDRIFGGSEADASKYPFVVSLRQNDAGGSTYCGGALIASQYVVTAAHCVKTDRATIYASIGTAFASGSSDGQQVKVIQGYRHPKYNKSAHLYDVGLLKLEKKVSTTTVGLAAPDGSDNTVGTVATVRGWGLTENGSQSVKMEEVNVNIISNAECNKEYGKRITEGMMCAGNGDGKDTCNGDSGVLSLRTTFWLALLAGVANAASMLACTLASRTCSTTSTASLVAVRAAASPQVHRARQVRVEAQIRRMSMSLQQKPLRLRPRHLCLSPRHQRLKPRRPHRLRHRRQLQRRCRLTR